jgi:hypothetical protein
MSTDRDTTRLVRSWLEEGVTALPDRVLDAVLDQVPATHQRRSWWPTWRFTDLNIYSKLAAAALAVVVVAVIGYQLIPSRPGGIGGVPTAAPSPTPSPTPSATPLATSSQLPVTDTGALPAGTYEIGSPFPVRVTVTVPAGWHGEIFALYTDVWAGSSTDGGLFFQIPSQVRVDPCDPGKGGVNIAGPTADDLVAAIRTIPGITVSNVASTSIGGYRGTTLRITAPKNISSCKLSSDGYSIWTNALGGTSPAFSPGEAIQFWILDVAGTRVAIGLQDANWTAAQKAEAQAVFQSIEIAPAN